MLGSFVSGAYQTTPTPEAERFFAALLQWAGVEFPVEVSGAKVEVRTLVSGNDTILFVFNHEKQPAESVITLNIAGDVHDLIAGSPIAAKIEGRRLRIPVSLKASSVRVFRIFAS